MVRINPAKAQGVEAIADNIGIVTRIQKLAAAILIHRNRRSVQRIVPSRHHIAEFAVDARTKHAAADGAAIDILIDGGAAHKDPRQMGNVSGQKLTTRIDIRRKFNGGARADRELASSTDTAQVSPYNRNAGLL